MKQRLQEAFLTTVALLKEVPHLEKSACPGHFPFRQSSIRLWMLKDVFHQRRFSRSGFADNPVDSAYPLSPSSSCSSTQQGRFGRRLIVLSMNAQHCPVATLNRMCARED
jgi:hypothetical protein